jgi:hypothetical protein
MELYQQIGMNLPNNVKEAGQNRPAYLLVIDMVIDKNSINLSIAKVFVTDEN